MSFYEYWIGEGIDLKKVWKNYEDGKGYINKYCSQDSYLLSIEFEEPSGECPLFNHEAIYKTIKGLYHDLKRLFLNEEDYKNSGPIYLYEIKRGSVDWSWVSNDFLGLFFLALLLWGKPVNIWLDSIKKFYEILEKPADLQLKKVNLKHKESQLAFYQEISNKVRGQKIKRIKIREIANGKREISIDME
jgi:hypothetical protein